MKINRIVTGFLAFFLISFSLNAFAAPDLSSLRTVKQGSNTSSNKMVRSASYARTEIHVLNSSSEIITVKVPGTPINDMLYPNEVEDILSDIYFDAVQVVLYDEDGYEFFRDYVPNHTTLEIKNGFAFRSANQAKQKTKVQAIIKK